MRGTLQGRMERRDLPVNILSCHLQAVAPSTSPWKIRPLYSPLFIRQLRPQAFFEAGCWKDPISESDKEEPGVISIWLYTQPPGLIHVRIAHHGQSVSLTSRRTSVGMKAQSDRRHIVSLLTHPWQSFKIIQRGYQADTGEHTFWEEGNTAMVQRYLATTSPHSRLRRYRILERLPFRQTVRRRLPEHLPSVLP